MTALAEIQVHKPVASVWDALVDPATHPHWLGPGSTTVYEGELKEGCKFRCTSARDGITREGEILSLRSPHFLKTRLDLSADQFEVAEYHLFEVDGQCRVRLLCEAFDTGELHHGYIVEVVDQRLNETLERLKNYCERAARRSESTLYGCRA